MNDQPHAEPAGQPGSTWTGKAAKPQRIWRRKKSGQLPERLMSVDALRGFDMFWIVGAGYLVGAIDGWSDSWFWTSVKTQLTHVDWAGMHFYDLIFPLFVFLVGVSIVLSLRKAVARDGRAATARKVVVRGAMLFAIGLFYSGGLSRMWPDIRLLGVLQRIALCYTAAGLLFLVLRTRGLVAATVALLLGYWLVLWHVSMPDVRMQAGELPALEEKFKTTNMVEILAQAENAGLKIYGQYEPGYNIANHFDFRHLPGKLYDTYWDPEGILSTFPAIATCLLGILSGLWLLKDDRTVGWRSLMLVVAGCLCFSAGWGWGLEFPVIKKIWTSSFVLVAGGYSMVLLGAFFYVVDGLHFQAWCKPFVWVGSNAITLYLASQILGFRKVGERFVGGDIRLWLNRQSQGLGDVVVALSALMVMLLLARFLYRRKIFLRV